MKTESILGEGSKPQAGDTVIDVGDGETWLYECSGIANLWVKGGIVFSTDRYTVKFDDIRGTHDKICAHLLSRGNFGAAEFRFLRKEVGLTVEDFASLSGMDAASLFAWEAGSGFGITGADKIIRELYSRWKPSRSLRMTEAA